MNRRSRHARRVGPLLFAACIAVACATAPPTSPTEASATAAATFAPNPNICPRTAGLRSGVRTRRADVRWLDLNEAGEALVAAGYEGVTRTDALGLADAVAAADERGDVVVVTATGDLAVVSSCVFDGLGQMHRLDDGLARLANATRALVAEPHVDATRRWALPAGIYGAKGTYWRQAAAAGQDLNAATSGVVAVTAPAQLGFVLAGASDPSATGGDAVGVQSLSLDGDVVISDDKRVVHGPASLRWQLPDGAAGSRAVALQLLVTDASLGWQVGTWVPYVEAWFPGDSAATTGAEATPASLAFSLQGGLPGVIRKARPVAELGLPAALTAVLAR